ncbi:MAG TPA: zinc ribbon domain-containing protein [Candidatus Polarisedimenticolia bacterium]|nr:zinc ribbon domain-containing protein [Candidatus Polarisedimenticolia bacterium]
MPLYEYECSKCGHRFEKIQKFSDPLVKTCPKCKGKVQKLPSAPAIQFKGSGWYITDYARKGESSGSEEKSDKASDEKSRKSAGEKAEGEKSAPEKPSEGKSDKDTKAAPKPTRKKTTQD